MYKIDMLFALIFVIKGHYTRFQKQTVFKTKKTLSKTKQQKVKKLYIFEKQDCKL